MKPLKLYGITWESFTQALIEAICLLILWAVLFGFVVAIVTPRPAYAAYDTRELSDVERNTSAGMLTFSQHLWDGCSRVANGDIQHQSDMGVRDCILILAAAANAPSYCYPDEWRYSVSILVHVAKIVMRHWKRPSLRDASPRWQEPLHAALERELSCLKEAS